MREDALGVDAVDRAAKRDDLIGLLHEYAETPHARVDLYMAMRLAPGLDGGFADDLGHGEVDERHRDVVRHEVWNLIRKHGAHDLHGAADVEQPEGL